MSKIIKQLGEIAPELNKQGIIDLAVATGEAIQNGNYDVLRTYIELKRYETYLKALIEATKKMALDAASANDLKTFSYHKATVSVQRRTKWDYAVDDKWNQLVSDIKTLAGQRKEHEEYLQHYFSGDVVDPETGEVVHVDSLPKTVESVISIKLD